MLLYLVQHAEALSKEEDPARSLSEQGIQDIIKVAGRIAGFNIKVGWIYHSTKIRAFQTAMVLADQVKVEREISQVEGLAPMDDPKRWADCIEKMNEDVMLVGHLPHLSRLASLLLEGDKNKNVVDFKMGGVVCLKKSEQGSWSVEWMITPEEIQ
ncbi:MAG: phosphohistidine phosphatase SixA [Nitrospirae bacterium]|nr:phosphohistidine phosphatase SixA [Nitrospirota bacterium]